MKKLSAYLKNREDNIYIQIGKPRSKYTTSTFHILRVEIKKLDAIFDLINFCSKNFSRKENFRPFKIIFHQAGKIREIQLEENMLKNYFGSKTMKNYRNVLKRIKQEEKDKFFLLINRKKIIQLEKIYKKTYSSIKNAHSKKVEKFIREKNENIRKILREKKFKALHLHKLRKLLKEFYYILKSLDLEGDHLHINSLQHLLGKWHDGQIMKKHLSRSIHSKKLNSFEVKHLRKIQIKVTYETNLVYLKIRKLLLSPQILIELSNENVS